MTAHRRLLAAFAFIAMAAVVNAPAAQSVGEGLRIETGAVGIERDGLVTDRFGIRALVNSGPVSYNYDESGIRSDGLFRFGTSFLLADWHPYAGSFRLSGGLAYNNQRLAGTARAVSAINMNGGSYWSSEVGSFDGPVRFSRASPYVGVGWGLAPRAGSRLYFSADLGVMYQRPSASLMGSCRAALSASTCNHLQGDTRAEEGEFREGADDLRFYPVISVGFGLRF